MTQSAALGFTGPIRTMGRAMKDQECYKILLVTFEGFCKQLATLNSHRMLCNL